MNAQAARTGGATLLSLGTAAAIFAVVAPGRDAGPRTLGLGTGVRSVSVTLERAEVAVRAGERASLRVRDGEHVTRSRSGAAVVITCAAGRSCVGARLELTVPRATDLAARLHAGRAEVTGIAGRIDLEGESAALSAIDVRPSALRAVTGSGAVHISLNGIASTLTARTRTSPISIAVPYAYASDGYRLRIRTQGHRDLDITRSPSRSAPTIDAASRSGDLLITQRYPNMS